MPTSATVDFPKQFYAIAKDGLFRVSMHSEFVGPQTDLLIGLAKQVPRIIRLIAPNTHLMVNATGVSIAKRLTFLALHTYFKPMVDSKDEKAVVVPCWTPPGAEIKCTWNPPAGMDLFFVARWEGATDDVNPHAIEPYPYLIARDAETRRTYLLPIPNLYDDGRICLGRGVHLHAGTDSIMTAVDKGVEILQKSTWNTDLLRQVERATHALFRFDANGKQLPGEKTWTEWCTPINNSFYEFVSKL